MRFKKAFTMAEAIIVMTILGIIATIMITNLKPSEFRDKGLQVQAKKVLMQLDTATQQIVVNNTQNGKMTTVYQPGTTTQNTFSAAPDATIQTLYKKYLVTTRKTVNATTGGTACNTETGALKAFLKDGACVVVKKVSSAKVAAFYPGESGTSYVNTTANALGSIFFDINGADEPNLPGKDQYRVPINADGIFYD